MRLYHFFAIYHKKILCVLILLGAAGYSAAGTDGVTKDFILIGQSCALSGPARDLGIHMKAGIEAAFKQCNTRRTVNGRQVLLISMDDYYEPGQAIKNTHHLIHIQKVFVLMGQVGTPTSKAVAPIAAKAEVPFLAPYTGARFLRQPLQKNIINIRAGYDQETEHIAGYLVRNRKMTRIACFYQNDSFGKAGLDGLTTALKRYHIHLVAQDYYQRNTLSVMGGLLRIRQADPQAVVLVGAYQPVAEFIKLGRAKGMPDTLFCSLSFAGAESLKNALQDIDGGIIISQVVPLPEYTDIELVRNYKQAMAEYQPELNISTISFEGYIAGRFFIEAARSVTGPLTRQAFVDAVEKAGTFDIGGLTLTFGPDDHQGLDTIYLTTIENKKIVPVDH